MGTGVLIIVMEFNYHYSSNRIQWGVTGVIKTY